MPAYAATDTLDRPAAVEAPSPLGSGGGLFGVRVVVDDCLPQGEARLVSTTDEARLVNIGAADE